MTDSLYTFLSQAALILFKYEFVYSAENRSGSEVLVLYKFYYYYYYIIIIIIIIITTASQFNKGILPHRRPTSQ